MAHHIDNVSKSADSVYEKEPEVSSENGVRETTRRGLKARHAQMIALGGTIGT